MAHTNSSVPQYSVRVTVHLCKHVKSPFRKVRTKTILAMSAIPRNVASFVTPHKRDNGAHSDVTSQKLSFPCQHVNSENGVSKNPYPGVFQKISSM